MPLGETHHAPVPAAVYGFVLLMPAIGYFNLQYVLIRAHETNAILADALGTDWKGKISMLLYIAGIALAFLNPWISIAVYVVVALIWLVPDRRIERVVAKAE